MRHQAEHLPVRGGDAGDIFQGAVGIVGILATGRGQVIPAVRERDHLPAPDPVKGILGTEEVPLPVGYRAVHPFDSPRPEVVRRGFQVHKPAFQYPFLIWHQGYVALVLPVKCRDQPEVRKDLEPVTDPEDEVVAFKEFTKILPEIVPDPVCIGIAGSGVIPVREPAGKNQQPVVKKMVSAIDQVIDMDNIGTHAGAGEHLVRLHLGVYPITAHDEGLIGNQIGSGSPLGRNGAFLT